MLGWWGGSYEDVAVWEVGLLPLSPPTTDAEKVAFLEDLNSGIMTNIGALLSDGREYLFGYPRDDAFAKAAIEGYISSPSPVGRTLADMLTEASNPWNPMAFDLTGASFDGQRIRGVDFSLSTLDIASLNGSELQTVSLAGLDLTGWVPSRPLSGVDLSGTQNLNVGILNNLGTIAAFNLSGLDLTGFTPAGKNVSGTNFSNVTGVTGAMLSAATYMANANFTGLNLAGFNPVGKDISSTNYTDVTGITAAALNGATTMYGVNFGTLDMTGFSANGKNLNRANFSNTSNFNGAMVNGATVYEDSVFNNQNMTGFNPAGKSLMNVDFVNSTGLTPSMLASAASLRQVDLTGAGISRSALDAALTLAGKNPAHSDFSNIQGLLP